MPNCNICKYAGRPTYKSPCSECKEFSKYECENKKTNADIIRSMSDEELVEIFRHDLYEYVQYKVNWRSENDMTCTEYLIEWLKQSSEGE